MIPVLSDSYPYTGNGLGGLADALECTVTHEVNGIYELKLRYPITGEHYAELLPQYFIMAKPDALTQTQPFRIYRITKPLNGVVTVYARHISYDMAGIVVEPFSDTSLTAALLSLPSHCTPSLPFTITSTKSVATAFSLSAPRELWRLLGGSAGSFLDIYGGEWDFDLLTATLRTRLGSDRGVKIRYGKNLTGLEQDATLESTYSGVYPYWYDEETGTLVEITNKYVPITGASVTNRLLILDCSGDFDTQPTEAQLTARATAYIEDNSVGSPKTSWKVNFAMLAQAGEYETQGALESVALGDTLEVIYEDLGVNASARVVKIEYDNLKEQYKNVTVGRVKQNLASIIVGQNQEMDAKIQSAKSELERAVDRSTDFIRNGAGYMRLIYDGDTLKEIVSLDNPDISLAQKVWRWNNGGFGFSSTGYNGTYGLALTQNGEIVADYITAGTLNANVIRAGIIADTQGFNSWNLQTGAFTITNGSVNITTTSQTYDAIKLSYQNWMASMAPIEIAAENSGTKKKFRIQAGAIFGYSDYTASTPARDVLISADGNIYLGGGTYTGSLILNNANGNAVANYYGASITLGGDTAGQIILQDSANANRIVLSGSTGNIAGVSASLGNASLGAGTLYVNNASGTASVVLNGSTGAFTGASISLTGQANALGGILKNYLYIGGSSTYNGYLQLTNSSDTGTIVMNASGGTITAGSLTLGGMATGTGNLKVNRSNGTNGIELSSSLDAMIIKAANGTNYRTALSTDGLYFYNSSGTQTALYPSGGLSTKQGTSITSNVESGVDTKVYSVTLPAGMYLLYGFIGFSSNATGRRFVSISSSSTSTTSGLVASDSRAAVSGAITRVSLTGYVRATASTTYYLWVYQNSGSTLTVSPLSMYAIKLP